MKPLLIEATESSPKIDFNTFNNIFEISGFSRPENSGKFYEYIIQWVENYGKELAWQTGSPLSPARLILKVKLEYFNSTSAKYILLLLDKFNAIAKTKAMPVDVNWYYDEMDSVMKESGEEYSKLEDALKFHFIANS